MNDVIQRLIDTVHWDSKHPIASPIQPFGLPVVCVDLVEWAINLNYETRRHADEVDEVRTNGELAPELIAIYVPIPQPRPDATLGLGHVVA